MNFKYFIKNGMVRCGSGDKALARSLIKTSENDLKFLGNLKIDNNSARKVITNYYDVLRSILEAISASEGYKIYSHEAFTFFLKEKGEDLIADKFDRFRKIRNKINYYGKEVSVEEYKAEIVKLINIIKEKFTLHPD